MLRASLLESAASSVLAQIRPEAKHSNTSICRGWKAGCAYHLRSELDRDLCCVVLIWCIGRLRRHGPEQWAALVDPVQFRFFN